MSPRSLLPRLNARWAGLLSLAVAVTGTLATPEVRATASRDAATGSSASAQYGTDGRVGELPLLSDPFLQAPQTDGVSVVWMTETPGERHVVLLGSAVADLDEAGLRAAATGTLPAGVRMVTANSSRLSRTAEDAGSKIESPPQPAEGIVSRPVYRHEAVVQGLASRTRTPYRVVSVQGSQIGASGVFRLAPAAQPDQAQRILLTSDHQAMVNTPANLQQAKETLGDIDAVFLAGDLVNIPDRASEWFDDDRGSAFFPVLQGRGGRQATNGQNYRGGEIVQNAPLFPAIGNHEVQGRRAGQSTLNTSFNAPVPRAIAEREYRKVAATVNPTGDPARKTAWIEDNSFSTTTYEEIFSLPEDSPGAETYYATTVGDVRLISLYSTRIWRGTAANPEPADRSSTSRYQESKSALEDPLAQGYGEHIFESLESDSQQLKWLEKELTSAEFRAAPIKVVMLHEGPQGLGDNVMPVFANPERIESRDAEGGLTGVRYEYRTQDNMLVQDLQPILEKSGVDLVLNGHSHLWNRFRSRSGTNFLETSNTGNTYGAFHGLSNRTRPLPPEPWDRSNYLAIGNPGGLKPLVPNVQPFRNPDGVALPFVQSNDLAVFAVLDTAAREVVSYVYDVKQPDVEPWVFDRFPLGKARTAIKVTDGSTRHGSTTRISGTVRAGTAPGTGAVQVAVGSVRVSAKVSAGRFTATVPTRGLLPGRHRITVTHAGQQRDTGRVRNR